MMMKLIAFFTALLALFYTPTPVTPVGGAKTGSAKIQSNLTVMTYNLKVSGVGKYSPENRAPLLARNIMAFKPDSFGCQEASVKLLAMVAEKLPDYAYVGVGRDKGNEIQARRQQHLLAFGNSRHPFKGLGRALQQGVHLRRASEQEHGF